jgi:hypothetical protein
VDAQASIAPAYEGRNPVRFMTGMVMVPAVSTLETIEPDIMPSRPLAKMQTFAAPPRKVPHSANDRLMKNLPAPVIISAEPNTRKPITVSANACTGMPSRLSDDSMW